MKAIFKAGAVVVCAFALTMQGAQAREVQASVKVELTPQQEQNLRATDHYYAQLISGTTPRIAELTLFANMLPKGGDLHHHYSGAMYAETYLDWVGAQNYCIYTDAIKDLGVRKFQIETNPQSTPYAFSKQCITADAARANSAFYRDLLKTWSDKDFDNHTHEQTAPDQHFFDTFGYFGAVSAYDFNAGLKLLKTRAKAENVGYIETMLVGSPSIDGNEEVNKLLNDLAGNTTASPSQLQAIFSKAYRLLINDASKKSKQTLDDFVEKLINAGGGLDDDQFTLRFQAYVSRNSEPAKVFTSLFTSFEAATRTWLVVGVNIVGPENGPVAMRDYGLHMQMFKFFTDPNGHYPNVKRSLHAGELVLGMVPPEGLRSHIWSAVNDARANRIGHGVDIAQETNAIALLNDMYTRKVAVEVNLTSNAFILGVQPETHPLQLYARFGVPYVISTDDAGVSRNNLSGEYLVFMSRFKPSYSDLKNVVYNSIDYSFLSDMEKREQRRRLDQRFIEFEAKMSRMPAQ